MVIKRNLSELFSECVEESVQYNLRYKYIGIISPQGTVGIPVKEILTDGFVTVNDEYYPFVPFKAISKDLAEKIRVKEKELNNSN